MKVGIIGAGLIGTKRAQAVSDSKDRILKIADIEIKKAENLASKFQSCQPTKNWQDVVNDTNIQVIVVSTSHDFLAPVSLEALKSGKHVLSEKPLGINSNEVKRCVETAKRKGLTYKAGYNHRFHPAISKAKKMFDEGKIGKVMYIKANYGHGGRPGYEKEWRASQKISGGGELIDQGAHLVDLAFWFMNGPTKRHKTVLTTSFWPMKVEDNVFMILEKNNSVAQLHAGWTEWKNTFSFEIFGKTGYLKVNGLGGSYGQEILTHGKRIPGKAPQERVWKFEKDTSWKKEWKNFSDAIKGGASLIGSGEEGYQVLKLIEAMYNSLK